MTNIEVGVTQRRSWEDGPAPITFPTFTLCRECATDVRRYIESRIDHDLDARKPFSDADIEAILDRLVANEDLEVHGPNIQNGIRHRDGEWHERIFVIGTFEIRTLSREKVKGRLRNASQINVSRLDSAQWRRHYEDPDDRRSGFNIDNL